MHVVSYKVLQIVHQEHKNTFMTQTFRHRPFLKSIVTSVAAFYKTLSQFHFCPDFPLRMALSLLCSLLMYQTTSRHKCSFVFFGGLRCNLDPIQWFAVKPEVQAQLLCAEVILLKPLATNDPNLTNKKARIVCSRCNAFVGNVQKKKNMFWMFIEKIKLDSFVPPGQNWKTLIEWHGKFELRHVNSCNPSENTKTGCDFLHHGNCWTNACMCPRMTCSWIVDKCEFIWGLSKSVQIIL